MAGRVDREEKAFFMRLIGAAPVRPPAASIAAWVEGRRVLPANAPIPGPWRNAVTPYGVEIMDNLAPDSGITRTVVMKARKVGLTTIMENAVAYYMLENPSDILYSTASEDLARDWGDRKIMEVIRSLDGLDRITANEENRKKRRTGNRTYKKEYIGGALDIVSARSKMALRALDKRCLFIDETDGVKPLTSTDEGLWTEILFGHTISWGARKKIALFSSPTTLDASLINKYYNQTDCRRFLVPCPYCGELIELRLDLDREAVFGLKAETRGGEIVGAYYLCEYCKEPIRNNQKTDMFSGRPRCLRYPEKRVEKRRWEPTRKSDDPAWRGYHLNALYSPLGMLTFEDIAKEREKAEAGTPDDRRSYVNIYQGRPYKDEGSRPALASVLALRGGYLAGTVPDGVVYLTAAADVQAGSGTDPANPPRLEVEILGHGEGYRTWGVEYLVFKGATDDPYGGAFEGLYQYIAEGKMRYRSAAGTWFIPRILFIDSGNAADGLSDAVYRFCERVPGGTVYPIKGFGELRARGKRGELADAPGPGAFKRYRVASIGSRGESVVEINTVFYKNTLYANLKIPRRETEPQRAGFCDFPINYPDEYFAQLTGEEKMADGSYRRARNRVEALDCRVYNLCAGHFWLDALTHETRNAVRRNGGSQAQALRITNKTVLDQLAAEVRQAGAAALAREAARQDG